MISTTSDAGTPVRTRPGATEAVRLITLKPPQEPAAPAGAKVPHGIWRDARCCGGNCLYLLMVAHSHPIDHAAVLDAVPTAENGSTVKDMVVASRALGFPVEARRIGFADLTADRLPVIAYMENWSGHANTLGHFLIVTSIDPASNNVNVFDGITALPTAMPTDAFARYYSGVSIVPAPPTTVELATAASAGAAIGVLIVFAWRRLARPWS